MEQLTDSAIRKSFINATRSEVAALNLPANFAELDWDSLDYLGWRDPKMPRRGYLVTPPAPPGPAAPGVYDSGTKFRTMEESVQREVHEGVAPWTSS